MFKYNVHTSVQALCYYGLRVILQAANQTINSRQSSSLPCIKSSIQSPAVPARSHFDFRGRCNALGQVRVEIFVNQAADVVKAALWDSYWTKRTKQTNSSRLRLLNLFPRDQTNAYLGCCCLVFMWFITLLLSRETHLLLYEEAISDGAIPFCVAIPVTIQLLVTMLVDELGDRVHVSSNSSTYAIDNGSDDLELEGFILQNIIFNIKQSQRTQQFGSYELFHEKMSATWSTQQPAS